MASSSERTMTKKLAPSGMWAACAADALFALSRTNCRSDAGAWVAYIGALGYTGPDPVREPMSRRDLEACRAAAATLRRRFPTEYREMVKALRRAAQAPGPNVTLDERLRALEGLLATGSVVTAQAVRDAELSSSGDSSDQ